MSGLFSTLGSSVKALSAQSRAIETAGKNLANLNNTSYARQRVIFGDRGTVVTPEGAQSLGIEVLGIQQLRDGLLDKQVMREISLQSGFEAEQQFYSRTQAALGQTIDRSAQVTGAGANSATGGLSAALDDFFNAFQSFAARPTDVGERQTLLQKSALLVDRFNQTDARLTQTQADIDEQIGTDLAEVNRLLGTIADLNGQIGRIEIGHPGAAIDLRDQRQARLEELAAKIPIQTRPATDGQIQVVLKNATNTDVVLVDLTTVTGPVAFTGTGLTAGAPATAVEFAAGSIRGALTARDGAIQTLRDDLDALALQVATSVNTAYAPAGGTFFAAGTTAGTLGLTAGLTAATLRAGAAGAPAGDNAVALAVAAVATQAFSTAGGDAVNGTLGQHYARAVSDLGQALASANNRTDDQTNIATLVRTQRESVSGVNLDEEMADLVRFQRAFQANSRVFSVVDELLDTVVNRLGV